MIYLAVIERRNRPLQGSAGKLQLLVLRGANGLWVEHKRAIALPVEKDRFHEGVLVIVQLGFKDSITSIAPAADEVVRALIGFSEDIFKQREDTELWNHSIQYQYVELKKREQELDRREDMIKIQEKTMAEIHKIMKEKFDRENPSQISQ